MSLAASSWAWKCDVGNAGRKLILLALADYADKDGITYPGQALLAEMTEMTTRSVRTHLDQLETLGFIKRTTKWRVDGTRDFDVFQLIGQAEDFSGYKRKVTTSTTGKFFQNSETHHYMDPISERSIIDIPSENQTQKQFDEFYKLYPRQTKRVPALKAWNRIKPDDDLFQKIMARLRTFIAVDWKGREKTFIPHPATWLNAAQWEDEVVRPAPAISPRGEERPAPPEIPLFRRPTLAEQKAKEAEAHAAWQREHGQVGHKSILSHVSEKGGL